MIRFRLRSAGLPDSQTLFTPDAVLAVHSFTQGYPRQIALLCHNALEALVIHDRSVVDDALIMELIRDESRWVHEAAS